MLHLQISDLGEQLGQAASRKRDFDAIGSDLYAAEQGHDVQSVGSALDR
jgi:hypothetical protein